MKKLLEKTDNTVDVAPKEGSGCPKTVHTEENIKLVEEMILSKEDQPGSHSIPTEIARELNIDHRSVPRVIDQDLGFSFYCKCFLHFLLCHFHGCLLLNSSMFLLLIPQILSLFFHLIHPSLSQ